jgi:hypothetical protein
MRLRARWFFVLPLCLIAAVAIFLLVSFSRRPSILAQRNSLIALARQYPN